MARTVAIRSGPTRCRRASRREKPDRQGQHVDAGPQRCSAEAVPVLRESDARTQMISVNMSPHTSEACQRARGHSEREGPDLEERQLEHRMWGPGLDGHKCESKTMPRQARTMGLNQPIAWAPVRPNAVRDSHSIQSERGCALRSPGVARATTPFRTGLRAPIRSAT